MIHLKGSNVLNMIFVWLEVITSDSVKNSTVNLVTISHVCIFVLVELSSARLDRPGGGGGGYSGLIPNGELGGKGYFGQIPNGNGMGGGGGEGYSGQSPNGNVSLTWVAFSAILVTTWHIILLNFCIYFTLIGCKSHTFSNFDILMGRKCIHFHSKSLKHVILLIHFFSFLTTATFCVSRSASYGVLSSLFVSKDDKFEGKLWF